MEIIKSGANVFAFDRGGAREDLHGAMLMRGTIGNVVCICVEC